MSGDVVQGEEFFRLLYADPDFSRELGKIALSAGMLEVELYKFLEGNNVKNINPRATLGVLISLVSKNSMLRNNEIVVLKEVCQQRNYLTHNLYALFSGKIEETVLPREELVELDVQSFIVKAQELNINLFGLSKTIRKYREST